MHARGPSRELARKMCMVAGGNAACYSHALMQKQVFFCALLWSVAPSNVRGGEVWAAAGNDYGQLGVGTSDTNGLIGSL